ncbi:MAG: tRNA (5-methylaminomethyl-2-thiouridine)(34)-methyltransferase MnmD [Gammaproteobacteria bacterium]|nr:tRNA (5-methylaminomethyl-2-thiouridine)(34)-methyltransferase MnmD [Gammaproteobacteria bacterium]
MNKDISPAHISLSSGKPVSITYDDCYFASEDAIAESHFDFIDGNQLPQRFTKTTPTLFTIAETGFGTGLNFMLAAELWHRVAPNNRKLHYISTEKHPIDKSTLTAIYQQQQWDNKSCQQVINNYPTLSVGVHNLPISPNITLTLLLGDSLQMISKYNFIADAWFLDGFNPAKNSDMWSLDLFQQIARHSRSKTTFATFTAASIVRKNLIAAGFVVNKTSGFGKKRERLIGYLD